MCSFLYDNWTGEGALVDLFQLQDLELLRVLQLSDVYHNGGFGM